MSVNKAILVGRIGADAELKHSQNGGAILRLRLATSETWKDKDGQRQERTEWHTVTMFGKRADGLARHLVKGTQVYIEGRISTREWQDKDGNKRWSTEIVANELAFLGGGKGQGGGQREQRGAAPSGPGDFADEFPPSDNFGDDDIPF